ncbi:1-deoxy-D-xylulose 5-phosphate reductoisomerase [Clostridium acetireducens DSM 10703]|uniref:1-deoxy-D-xylulose 5-phosphate reductoisomerase n=1 Tax=Clostridium acetireducens DSM 10703 TaxID=1121290 RepID=A0A1E8F243_9CLOT|nr:1-deoxy-D-xylulose-5-phosphate reductoisomerase [Clostridium acetireducens]OFI07722.1 1-deoxy-D-xylulose 5-phosphate reductoisomerase [Clostridium acetireducens DSM 10703]
MKRLSILGATGSIGFQTLDVIRKDKENFSLVAVSANKSYKKIIDIIKEFKPKYVVLMEKEAFNIVKDYCKINNLNVNILFGIEGLKIISTLPEVDIVVTSLVGMVGLVPTLEAIKNKKTIALANKETLVVGGEIVTREAKKNNVNIIPVDSEHSAIFQCLKGESKKEVDKIIITASGGPFRGKSKNELINVTKDQALSHPKWNMGKKISIDSATLMNKGLEVIEAHWLFNIDYNKIETIVHPESVIHSMVQYADGSVLAQLAVADMRLPIQYALNYPYRKKAVVNKLELSKIGNLTFEKPDLETFKPLKLAYDAGKQGGIMPTVLNAANEEAVKLFLEDEIKFLDIITILEKCMDEFSKLSLEVNLENILELDKKVRRYVKIIKYNYI